VGGGKKIVDDKYCQGNKNSNKQIAVERVNVEKNKLKIKKWLQNDTDCPKNCTCEGSTMKCELQNGRQMTVTAGKSGNIIIITKEIDVPTKANLYKADDGTLYRVTKNNETREIKILPDQIQEKIKEKVKAKIQNQSIELDENGNYQVQIDKQSKLFALFPVKEKVKIEINSETGNITKTRTSWWGFLAKDQTN
jgi:hypothetical protein